MKELGQIIREKGREQFYDYYVRLGYDPKTAAVLALFTYGEYRFRKLSMDDLYETLCKEEEYIPRDEWRRRETNSYSSMGSSRVFGAGLKRLSAPSPALKNSAGAPAAKMAKAATSAIKQSVSTLSGLHPIDRLYDSMNLASDDFEDDELCAAEEECVCFSSPIQGGAPSLLKLAGAAGFATDEYEQIEEKDARHTAAEPASTFRMTTNTASAGVILNQLRNGRRIDRSMVRIEEMLNYFRYESELPVNEMFRVSCELMNAENDKKYLYVNVQGKEEVKDGQNIVVLLDVSGSMGGNAEQTQAIIATIISKLGNGDKISLVTYSTKDSVEMEAFPIRSQKDRIRVLEKLLSINIDGCTFGSRGIETAYKIGKRNFIPGGNNQVILITDGDLNFGITDKGGLEELIERKKKDNLFLSVIGTGLYNYKDDKLEALSKHGNGVYRTVNSLTDVEKSVNEEYASLVNIIAKDVKAQVEFNPEVVESYRLLGFENRALSREDFTNDKVISEPFGSGGYGVAVYELKMNTGSAPADSGLKYSKLVTTGSRELGTVKIRYKEPLEDVSHELEKVIETADASFSDNLRLAFIVYVCAEKLRGSSKISSAELALARKLYQELGSSIREKNSADIFKLAGILDKTETELGIGIREEPFPW